MAVFTNSPDDCQRIDWSVLCNGGGIALYWREEYLADDVRWLAAQNYDIYEFACDRWDAEASMYSDIERVLRFSEWWGPVWGHNLDALDDCLTDLPISDIGGAALVFHKFNVYASGSGSASIHSGRSRAEDLLDVLARASRYCLLNGKRFIVLVQTEDPNLRIGALGGTSPAWNRREWLNANRTPESRSKQKVD